MDREAGESAPAAAPDVEIGSETAGPGGGGSLGAVLGGGGPGMVDRLARVPPAQRAAAVGHLQRGAGNRAVARRIAPAAPLVQRDLFGGAADMGKQMGEGEIHGKSEPERIAILRDAIKGKRTHTVQAAWESFGARAVEIARGDPELIQQSVDAGLNVDISPFADIKRHFTSDVEGIALAHMRDNRQFVVNEMDKLGAHGNEEKDKAPTAEQQHELHDVQKWAKLLDQALKALAGLSQTAVGFEETGNSSGGLPRVKVATFNPAGPPPKSSRPAEAEVEGGVEPKLKSWDEIKKSWDEMSMIKAVCAQRSPALAMLAESPESAGKVAGGDVATTRREVGKGLTDLTKRIDKAVPSSAAGCRRRTSCRSTTSS